jgi:hypothetical protein
MFQCIKTVFKFRPGAGIGQYADFVLDAEVCRPSSAERYQMV